MRTSAISAPTRRTAAWAVHGFTASGAVLGLLALGAAVDGDYRAAFLWMIAATLVDAVDGWFARAAAVKLVLPGQDGGRLDDIVDYLTYVFVPAIVVSRAGVLPPGWELPAAAAMLMSSALGFSRTDAKTADFFFTGFPSYWNIVVFYLMAGGLPPWMNAAVVFVLSALVFVPIGYIYPSRTPVLRRVTIGLGICWGASIVLLVWQWPHGDFRWLIASLAYPVYYVVLSLVLHARRAASRRV